MHRADGDNLSAFSSRKRSDFFNIMINGQLDIYNNDATFTDTLVVFAVLQCSIFLPLKKCIYDEI